MISIIGQAPMEKINDTDCNISIKDDQFLAKSSETGTPTVLLKHSLKSISMAARDCYEKSLVVYISNLDISEKKRNTGRNRRLFLFQMQDSVQSEKLFNLISQKFSTQTHFKCHQKKATDNSTGDYLRPWACSVHGRNDMTEKRVVKLYQYLSNFLCMLK